LSSLFLGNQAQRTKCTLEEETPLEAKMGAPWPDHLLPWQEVVIGILNRVKSRRRVRLRTVVPP